MSLRVAGNNLVLTKGDTLYLKVVLEYNSGGTYILSEGDGLEFGITSYDGKKVLVQKDIDTSNALLKLKPSDTDSLTPDLPYLYGVRVVKANGDIFTVVSGTLKLLKEVCE